ncbi:MAG: phosphotransferase [bacterium]|nr:phosphotransferase [bacterium]
MLRAFACSAERWLLARPECFAPVHGDYRLDNLLFGTSGGGAPVAAVDWQTLSIGHPGRDVAYFLGNAMPKELRREHERELVAAYHETLLGHGVGDYSLEQCFDDYRFGQFQGPLVTVLGAMAVIQTDRGDNMFMAMASRSCEAIRDLDSTALL